ncbi:MAG: nitroreductase family protein [Candidatus Cloacimonetes bacterium]|nr:nitroreductase family protein [Candidatus Cloacimonadota bacterium]
MEFMNVINTRHSVRDFKPDPIPEDILTEILEAGRSAPSAQNRQEWRYLVIQDKSRIELLSRHSGLIGLSNLYIRKAPCVIIACADTSKGIKLNNQDYYLVDTAISFQQMMLTAWNYGIGSCWLGAYNEGSVKKFLNLPKQFRIVGISPFGYPAESITIYTKVLKKFAGSEKRLPLDKTVRFEEWK